MAQRITEPIVEMTGINKSFGGVRALNDVSFILHPGEVLSIVGDNGAGKTTLIKILSGAISADSGKIYYKGKEIKITNTRDAKHLGIETIYQNLALADNLNFYQNIFMGREILRSGLLGRLGIINTLSMISEGTKLIERFGIKLSDPGQKVASLSGGQRQIVAICRAIYFNAEVIILDEPTAALGVEETQKVYTFIRTLRDRGISIIMISHNINEVFEIADRCMVMKTGSVVGTKCRSESSTDEIIQMIISGKDVPR
jgi:D-xylose transport system ATP-binding protein